MIRSSAVRPGQILHDILKMFKEISVKNAVEMPEKFRN